jgi:hypothetical protein
LPTEGDQPDRLGDRWQDERGVPESGEGHESDPVGKLSGEVGSDPERKPRLANATRTG